MGYRSTFFLQNCWPHLKIGIDLVGFFLNGGGLFLQLCFFLKGMSLLEQILQPKKNSLVAKKKLLSSFLLPDSSKSISDSI